jgi:transposase-like protein
MPKGFRISPETAAEMVRLYLSGLSTVQVGNRFGLTNGVCRLALIKAGVPRRGVYNYSPEQVEQAVCMYRDGETRAAIRAATGVRSTSLDRIIQQRRIPNPRGRRANEPALTDEQTRALGEDYLRCKHVGELLTKWEISPNALYRALERLGIAERLGMERHRIIGNEAAFEHAEGNPVAAYWVGLLMADGSIRAKMDKGLGLCLSLSGDDGGHVRELAAWLEWPGGVREYPESKFRQNGKTYSKNRRTEFVATSIKMAADLAAYGVVIRKTKTARAERLAGSRDFWRGVACGDGGISIGQGNRIQFFLCGTHALMEQFANFVSDRLGFRPSVYRRSACLSVVQAKTRPAVQIIRLLFQEGDVALHRKAELARRVQEITDQDGHVRQEFSSRSSHQTRRLRRDWSNLSTESLAALAAEFDGDVAKIATRLGTHYYGALRLLRDRGINLPGKGHGKGKPGQGATLEQVLVARRETGEWTLAAESLGISPKSLFSILYRHDLNARSALSQIQTG